MRHIPLDSSPLALITAPPAARGAADISAWAASHIAAGGLIYVPEVIDYEVRRELLRAGKGNSIGRLDALKDAFTYLPITTSAMLLAADLWAGALSRGRPMGDPANLDIDVILAAQALALPVPARQVAIATATSATSPGSSPRTCGRTSSPEPAPAACRRPRRA